MAQKNAGSSDSSTSSDRKKLSKRIRYILFGALILAMGFCMGVNYAPSSSFRAYAGESVARSVSENVNGDSHTGFSHSGIAPFVAGATGTIAVNEQYLEAFRAAKRQVVHTPKAAVTGGVSKAGAAPLHVKAGMDAASYRAALHAGASLRAGPGSKTDAPAKYKSCLRNFTALSGPVVEAYKQMKVKEQRQIAEAFWLRQEGKLWMQHSRKGGGTTLCMRLRLNQNGLMKTRPKQWNMPERETCQIRDLCTDCDLTKRKDIFKGWNSMPRLMSCAIESHQRNFNELEGTVSPPDLTTNAEWSNFVFVSTLRHPLARIISSLHNDPPYRKVNGCVQPTNPKELNLCAHRKVSFDNKIMDECHKGIYYCYSNYYVRMFAGHPNGPSNVVTKETLQLAKKNFLRYSCVVLQEQYETTESCLKTKLGLHLKSDVEFNVQGNLIKSVNSTATRGADIKNSDAEFLQSLREHELVRLKKLNALDLEFYDWAKYQILAGVFTG